MNKKTTVKLPVSTGESKRRAPSQGRSIQTVDILFQAAAQILEKEGEEALSTNRVASVAGFSIGTLYQYFPDKDTLVQAMGLRIKNQVLAQMDEHLELLQQSKNLSQQEPFQLVNDAVALVIDCMTLKGKNKSFGRLFWLHEPTDQMSMAAHQMAEKLSIFFEHVKHPQIKTPSVVELYVITRMVLGLTRYASLEKSSLLDSPLLKETISKMVFALLEK